MWTDCPSDWSTLRYCLSASPAPVAPPSAAARPSRCNGDECEKEAEPRPHARGPPSNPPEGRLEGAGAGAGGGCGAAPREGETDCERRLSAPLPVGGSANLDISCLSCAWPTSSFRIFFRSSSPVDSIAGSAERSESDQQHHHHDVPPGRSKAASPAAPESSKGCSFRCCPRGRFELKWSKNS